MKLTDEEFMRKALRLAAKGSGFVSPNPLVGAIVVLNGHVVGEGFHQAFGKAHAEVEALARAGDGAQNATLYVNLEPCCHHGKQPPCVDAILKAGIRKVVIGTKDPNPLVDGRGIEKLRKGGVEVTVGILEQECRQLNEAFFKHTETGLPFQTLKVAQTLDGKIADATGHSRWITGEQARVHVHRLRAAADAILVGVGTVLQDNPSLTVRHTQGHQPVRLVLDSRARLPLTSKVLCDAFVERTVVVTTPDAPKERIAAIRKQGAQTWQIAADDKGHVDLQALSRKLGQSGMNSVLVEGGATVFSSYLRQKLADKILVFISAKILGRGRDAFEQLGVPDLSHSLQLRQVRHEAFGQDLLVSGYLN